MKRLLKDENCIFNLFVLKQLAETLIYSRVSRG